MTLGDRFYPKIRIFKQSDINDLGVNANGTAKDPTEAKPSYQFGYDAEATSTFDTRKTVVDVSSNISSLTTTTDSFIGDFVTQYVGTLITYDKLIIEFSFDSADITFSDAIVYALNSNGAILDSVSINLSGTGSVGNSAELVIPENTAQLLIKSESADRFTVGKNLEVEITSTFIKSTAEKLGVVSVNIVKGINTNLGGCNIVITNAKNFINDGILKLGFNEFIEVRFSPNKVDVQLSTPVTWFRGFIQSVKYVRINSNQQDLILEAVGEGVILKERLTKIDRLRPFGKITRLDESVTPAVHIEQEGFLDELYQETINNTTELNITQFFQTGGFNYDPRTKRLGAVVTALDKLPPSITRNPFQTKINELIKDMFGVIPTTIPANSAGYINPVVTRNDTSQLLRLIDSGNGVQDIGLILPQFKSDYGTIISAIDTLSASSNSIYYVDVNGHFIFRQTPLNSGKEINVDSNLYNSYSFSDDIISNGFSSITGLGFNEQEFNVFRKHASKTFATTLNRATRWRSAGTPNASGDVNVNGFRRSNNIGIVFRTGDNTDVSSIELPLIRIGDITSALQWEIREKDELAITAKYDVTGKDSQLILSTGVITATRLNEIVPYLYETWNDTDLGNTTGRDIELIDSTFDVTNNNVSTANQSSLIELPITASGLKPNTEYMLVIRPPIDINGLPVNGIPSVRAANGVVDNLLFVYNLSSGTDDFYNLRRWATTPAGLTSDTLFNGTGGIKVLQSTDTRVVETLTPFKVDTTLGDTFGNGDKSSIPLLIGAIPIRINVERSTVITSENALLSQQYGLREITVPFPSNANAAVVKTTILDIQLNLFNQRNRVYSDFVYEFPTTVLEAGTSIDIVDNNNQTGIGLNQSVLVSQVTIDIDAESGKDYIDRITVKGTVLI